MHSLTIRFTSIGLGLAAGFAIQLACTTQVTNEAHCFYHEGNATCVERYGDELPYCGTSCLGRDGNPSSPNGDGCVDFVPDDGCYSPCGGEQDVTENDMCSVADTGTGMTEPTTTITTTDATTADSTGLTMGTSTMSSETVDSTGTPVECEESSDCTDPNLPLCLMQTCSACGAADEPDAACAAKDPTLGVCGNDGACVQCTGANVAGCTGTTPVCDEAESVCIGCTDHAQCPATACAFETGECLDEACVIDVDGDGGQDFTSIQAAVGSVGAGMDCTILVHDYAAGDYGTATIDGGKRIALFASGTDVPRIEGNTGAGIEVTGDAVLYARGLDVRGNTDDVGIAITDDGTSAYVDGCTVAQNFGGGITVDAGSYLRLRNSMVGSDTSDVAAVNVDGGTAEIVYATLGSGFGTAAALRCTPAATVDVRNSLLVARTDDPEVDCIADSLETSATEAELGDMNLSWFAAFGTGNFHLTASAPGAVLSAAEWRIGDPATDIDGDARPEVDGTADVAGADVP